MNKEELRSMVREIIREELADCLRNGLEILEDKQPNKIVDETTDETTDEAAVDDAFKLLGQYSDVMSSWMDWAADEEDETEWRDFDG